MSTQASHVSRCILSYLNTFLIPSCLPYYISTCLIQYHHTTFCSGDVQVMDGVPVYEARLRMGEVLAKKILKQFPEHEIGKLSSALYCAILYYTVLYCTALYCTELYCTALHCTVLYCRNTFLVTHANHRDELPSGYVLYCTYALSLTFSAMLLN